MTGMFTFDHQKLAVLLATAKQDWKKGIRTLYGMEETNAPGFWIVGDEGVYVMSNAVTDEKDERRLPIVYAEECNPDRMPFDDWYDYKNKHFGGDDGAEFIEASIIEGFVSHHEDMEVEFTPGETTVMPDMTYDVKPGSMTIHTEKWLYEARPK